MRLTIYINWLLVLSALDAVVLTFFYAIRQFGEVVFVYIICRAGLDLALVSTNWQRAKLSRLEVALLLVTLGYFVIGVYLISSEDSTRSLYRALNDVLWPTFTILKIAVIRALVASGEIPFTTIRRIARFLLFCATTQVCIFVLLSGATGAYAGITPPVNVPFATALSAGQPLHLMVIFAIILLSGKRSFLLAALLALAVYILSGRRRTGMFIWIITGVFILLSGYFAGGFDPIDQKIGISLRLLEYADTDVLFRPERLFDDEIRSALYLSTAGRSEEFYAILGAMSPHHWLTGLGAGFTYTFMLGDEAIEGYANAHFSPLAMTYKFGFIYCVVVYIYLFRGVLDAVKSNTMERRVAGYVLILFAVQSIFAFNLFVELFLPLFAAMNQKYVNRANHHG